MPIQSKSARAAGRKKKRRAVLKDPESTGRKEAARLYPLDRDEVCEWSFEYIRAEYWDDFIDEADEDRVHMHIVKLISGGPGDAFVPCKNNNQKARHHGPDKTTTNNEEGNVHRICHNCHNKWHAVNDPEYDPMNTKASD